MTQKMKDDSSLQMEDDSASIKHVSWFLSVITRAPKYFIAITTKLHIIHFAICSVIVIYDAKEYFTSSSDIIGTENDIYAILYYVNVKIMCYGLLYFYVYHGFKQYDKWPKLLSKMGNLDQQISKETPMNNRPIKIIEWLMVILATFGPLFLIIYVVHNYFTENIISPVLLLYYKLGQSFFNSFIFNVIIYVLYHRFQTINKLIMQLNEQFNAPVITSKIRCIRKLHKEICDVVITVNDIHGLHLLLFTANCITMVLVSLYGIYISIFVKKEHDALMLRNNILWILYTAQFGVTCWICTLMRQESEKTRVIISTVALNCNDVNLDNQNGTRNQSNVVPSENQDGEQYSNRSSSNNENHDVLEKEINNFWIQSQRVAITACNYFEMNNALFSCFVGVIINYVIIIIQSKSTTERLQEHKNISLQHCQYIAKCDCNI